MSDPEVGFVREHRPDQRIEVRRPAAVIDVQPVRLGADRRDVRPGPPVGQRSQFVRRTVSAIDDHPDTLERKVDAAQQMVDVLLRSAEEWSHPADLGTRRSCERRSQGRLDVVLDDIGQFVPTTREELDPVVRHRVMARREHDPDVGAGPAGQVGKRWRWEDAGQQDVGAGARQPGDDGGFEHLTAGARIPADYRNRPVQGVGFGQNAGSSSRNRSGQFWRQIRVGQPPHAIGSEQARHAGLSAWSTAAPCVPSSGRTSYVPSPAGRG